MAQFQPPPTWSEVIVVDENTGKASFSPVWLKWFIDLVDVINASGGGGGAVSHNSTSGLQGGTANQYYHLTAAEQAAVSAFLASATTALLTLAGTTAVSSLRLPHGVAPTSPVNGDVWTTTAGLFVRINGGTVGPLS